MLPLNLQGRVIRAINNEIRTMTQRRNFNYIRYEAVLGQDGLHLSHEGAANLARAIYDANQLAAQRPSKLKKL